MENYRYRNKLPPPLGPWKKKKLVDEDQDNIETLYKEVREELKEINNKYHELEGVYAPHGVIKDARALETGEQVLEAWKDLSSMLEEQEEFKISAQHEKYLSGGRMEISVINPNKESKLGRAGAIEAFGKFCGQFHDSCTNPDATIEITYSRT